VADEPVAFYYMGSLIVVARYPSGAVHVFRFSRPKSERSAGFSHRC